MADTQDTPTDEPKEEEKKKKKKKKGAKEDKPASRKKAWDEKLKDYFFKKPFFVIYNLGLIYGGGIAYIFFGKIHFLPEFDFKDIASILLGLALFAGIFTIIMILYFVTPSWVLRGMTWEPYCKLIGHAPEKSQTPPQKTTSGQDLLYGISSAVMSVFAFGVFGLLITVGFFRETDYFRQMLIYSTAIISIAFVTQAAIFAFNKTKNKPLEEPQLPPEPPPGELGAMAALSSPVAGWKFIAFLKFSSWLLLAWLICSVSLFSVFVYPFLDLAKNNNFGGMGLLAVIVGVVILANSILATVESKSYLAFPIVGTFLLFAFLVVPDNKFSIVDGVFRALGLGDIPNTSFVVNTDTCKTVNTLRPTTCSIRNDLGCILPPRVASRIGTEFILSFPAASDDPNKPKEQQIPLKKEAVLVWSKGGIPIGTQKDGIDVNVVCVQLPEETKPSGK